MANKMEPKDGLIWVYCPEYEGGIMALSDDGVENLCILIAIHRDAE